MENRLKGKVMCVRCGKNYKYKKEGGKNLLICSGYANYGKKYCSRGAIDENDIIDTIKRHLIIYKEEYAELNRGKEGGNIQYYVDKIEVGDGGEYKIKYVSGKCSIISSTCLKF